MKKHENQPGTMKPTWNHEKPQKPTWNHEKPTRNHEKLTPYDPKTWRYQHGTPTDLLDV